MLFFLFIIPFDTFKWLIWSTIMGVGTGFIYLLINLYLFIYLFIYLLSIIYLFIYIFVHCIALPLTI